MTVTVTSDSNFSGNTVGEVTEDAADNDDEGNLTITDPDGLMPAPTIPVQAATGTYGTSSVAAGGAWTYTLDNTDADTDALDAGDTVTDTFTVTASDGATQVVTITITGEDDAAVWSGDTTGAVTEDDSDNTATSIIDLTITDVDDDDPAITSQTETAGTYGTFSVTAGGAWTYTLENVYAATDALDDGDSVTEMFTVTASDGATQVVTITVTGADDAAVWSGDTTGAVTEDDSDNTATSIIDLTITDVDDDDPAITSQTETAGTYGTFSVTAGGAWTYTLENVYAATDALDDGDSVTEMFTVTASDGATQVVTITVTGADDAAVWSGDTTGAVAENAVANTATGTPHHHGRRRRRPGDHVADGNGRDVRDVQRHGGWGVDLHAGKCVCCHGRLGRWGLSDGDVHGDGVGRRNPGCDDHGDWGGRRGGVEWRHHWGGGGERGGQHRHRDPHHHGRRRRRPGDHVADGNGRDVRGRSASRRVGRGRTRWKMCMLPRTPWTMGTQ